MSFKIQTLRNAKQGWISNLWNQTKCNMKWYCDTTSLHGFRYITSKHSSTFTRWFFAFVSCCTVILCSYLSVLQFFQHHKQSTLNTVRSTTYPVWRFQFPAVTICNFNVVYKDNIQNLFDVVKKRGIKEKVFMNFVRNLSSLIVHDKFADINDYQEVFAALERAGYTTDRLMAELAQPCNALLKKCYWESEEVTCSNIFQSVKTSQGYCCSFNYYGTKDTAQNTNDTSSLHYQYVGGAGPTLGLRLLLDIDEEQYTSSIRALYGLNILVQDGADYPDMNLVANTLLSAEELTIAITPRVYVAANNIRSMRFQARRCLFEDERKLEWSSTYSYKTCITQCKANAIFKYCNCVPYYYPVQNQKRFCTLSDVPCLQNNKRADVQSVRDGVGETFQCKCYPQCNERMFDFHTDRGKAIPMDGFEYTNMSILNVYYNTVGCIETKKDFYYTWDRVFAAIGGIFGLCLGGSIISIFECIFFMGRFIPNCKKTKSEAVQLKEPEIYVSDFAQYYYRSNLEKKNLH